MTTTLITESEYIQQVAQEYRNLGYEIIFEPSPDQLPSLLQKFRPDLLIQNGIEHIVVEVRSRRELVENSQIQELAKAIHSMPQWRFELRLLPESPLIDATPYAEEDVHEKIPLMESLAKSGSMEAAFMIGWSLVEWALRRIGKREGIDVESFDTRRLLQQLVDQGIIDSAELYELVELYHIRNAIIHGFKSLTLTSEKLERFMALCRGRVAFALLNTD
ncbi:MAG: hypothetical protein AB7H80_00960 [Candidatus Kapaibacterium sp.]